MESPIFNGCELVFKQTYFAEPQRTVKIKTDAPVSSLGAREVPRSAGSFAFSTEGEPKLHNRFIVWRANGSNLYLEEFSVERDLQNSSLCVNFSQSVIIPGTVLRQLDRSLIIVVPTQSGVNRFTIPLQDITHEPLSIKQSVLSLFPATESSLARSHCFHQFSSNVASKAAVGVLADGTVVMAVSTDDEQLLRVMFRPSQKRADELVLEGLRVRHYFIGTWAHVWDACIGVDYEGRNSTVYSVHHDATVRVWKSTSNSAVFTASLAELLRVESKSPVVEAAIKAFSFPEQKKSAVVLKLQSSSACEFFVLEVVGDKLVKRSWSRIEAKHIVDYICTAPSTVNKQFCLWVIASRDDQTEEKQPLQPYVLKQCTFSMSINADSAWEDVCFGLGDEQVCTTLFEQVRHEAICAKIFEGDHFSPGVVRRAIRKFTPTLKTMWDVTTDLESIESMQDLCDYVTTHLDSLQRVVARDSFESGSLTDGLVKREKEKFWSDLYHSCVQLQEVESRPFAFLHSACLGIVGVIQQSRFTIYLPPDEEMRLMVGQHSKMLTSLFRVLAPSSNADITEVLKALDAEKSLTAIADYIDEFGCFIEILAEHSPTEVASNLIDNQSSYLASSFSTALLAMALRQRVMARLCFMDAIRRLILLLPHITATSTELRVNPRIDLVLNSHNCQIAETVSCYAAMWSAHSLTTLFAHHLKAGNAEEAVRTLLKNPDANQQLVGLRQLLNNLIDKRQTMLLVDISYGHLTEAVADMLEARCRAAVSSIDEKRAGIHEVTYAFHVARFNYDRAASVMYHLAQQMKNEVQTGSLLESRCRILATVHQTMQILPLEDQKFVAIDANGEVQLNEEGVPRYQFTRRAQDTGITTEGQKYTAPSSRTIQKEEIQRELMRAEARTQLVQIDPATVPSLEVEGILNELIKRELFDVGWVIIKEFQLPPYELLKSVCTKAIIVDAKTPAHDLPEWIGLNRQFVVDYDEKLKPHWKLVVSYVDLALQQSPTDAVILNTVGKIFLGYSVKVPQWLECRYKRVNFGDLLLLLVQYGEMKDAFDMLLPYIDLAISKVSVGETDFLLPMTQINRLLHYAKQDNDLASFIDKTKQMIAKLEAIRDSIRRYDKIGQENARKSGGI